MAEGEGQTETIQDPNSNAMPGLGYSVGTAGGTISLDSGTVWSSGVRWPGGREGAERHLELRVWYIIFITFVSYLMITLCMQV